MPDEGTVVLTREQLYEEVWSEPMATLAEVHALAPARDGLRRASLALPAEKRLPVRPAESATRVR